MGKPSHSKDGDVRADRLADALRANLHRRKSQARQRKMTDRPVPQDDEPETRKDEKQG